MESLPHREGLENLTTARLTSPVGRMSLSWLRSPDSCCLYSNIIQRNEIILLGSEGKFPGARGCAWEWGFNSQSLLILGVCGSLRCNNKDAERAGKSEGKKYQQNRKGKQRQINLQEISLCTFPQEAATVKCSTSMLQGVGPALSLAWSRALRSGVDASWSPNRNKPTLLLEKNS